MNLMSDPEKKELAPSPEDSQTVAQPKTTDLPEDLQLDAEPEGDIGKMVERGRQMGF